MEPFDKLANMTTGGIARGGRLTFDGERLRFGNHRLDKAITGEAVWAAPLEEVASVDIAKGSFSPRGLLNGGARSRLRILTRDGEERLFVISGAKKLAEELGRAVSSAR